MPFKDFAAGDILTAADVDNLLMRQTVMRFANATERDTALSAVLAEGMIAYLDDTDEVLKYDGTDWVAIGGGGGAGQTFSIPSTGGTFTVDLEPGNYSYQASKADNLVVGNSGIFDRFGFFTLTSSATSIISPFYLDSWQTSFNSIKNNETINSMAFSNGIYFSVGNNFINTSTNGNDWTLRRTDYGNVIWRTVLGEAPIFMVAGGNNGELATSTDSITWTSRTTGISSLLSCLTFGNDTYVVGGGSFLSTSTDGITWTSRTSGQSQINALTFGNGVFVSGGTGGTITTSTNGITWTTRTSGFGATQILALTFGNGVYVAGGPTATLTTSTNATTWTTRTPNLSSINALAFADGIFIAVGGALGTLATSTDAATWTVRESGTTKFKAKTAAGNGRYLLGGSGGFIEFADSSANILELTKLSPTDLS